MEDALREAKRATEINEVPVGCVFVYNDEVIAGSCNLVTATKNATRHAEFVCIDQVLDYCREKNLNYTEVFNAVTVVVTVEPCIMCSAALHNLCVKEIVYGCRNDRFGGTTVVNVSEIVGTEIPIRGGVRANEAMALLKTFYKGENPSAPPSIRKKKKND